MLSLLSPTADTAEVGRFPPEVELRKNIDEYGSYSIAVCIMDEEEDMLLLASYARGRVRLVSIFKDRRPILATFIPEILSGLLGVKGKPAPSWADEGAMTLSNGPMRGWSSAEFEDTGDSEAQVAPPEPLIEE